MSRALVNVQSVRSLIESAAAASRAVNNILSDWAVIVAVIVLSSCVVRVLAARRGRTCQSFGTAAQREGARDKMGTRGNARERKWERKPPLSRAGHF